MQNIKKVAVVAAVACITVIAVVLGWQHGRQREIESGIERKNFIRCVELAKRQKSEVSVMNDAVQKFSKETEADDGWLVFAQGDSTYRLAYPSGELEKIGEFMYSVSYSPDGRYRAYCTANDVLTTDWLGGRLWEEPYYTDFLSRWNEIPQGWYVEELSSGKMAYIPMPAWSDDRPLKGGRCVWIDRSKLHEIIGD